jgi:hypothetical protein
VLILFVQYRRVCCCNSSAVVQCLLVIQLFKRLSFPFTYFATQNARKVRGNRCKVISIDDK